MARKYHQGKYRPKFPEKYIGDPTDIVYRSRWELRCMCSFDENPSIIRWGSEEVVIPYYWEGDNKSHRYFTDFVLFAKSKNGEIKKCIVEVKPYAQTIAPVRKGRKKMETYLNEIETYSKNTAKWLAARAFCKERGYTFLIITEKDIFPDGKVW